MCKYKTLKNLVLEFFVVFLLVIKFECPVYRGNFVLKRPFLGRKSVRFKEGPVYECPVYRGKINKKNFLTGKTKFSKLSGLGRCPVYRVSG